MATRIGLGVLLPLERGSGGYFRQGFTALEQVESNLMNLLSTKKGERPMNPNFGCEIHSLVFENLTENIKSDIDGTIQEAVSTWMPQVTVVLKDVYIEDTTNSLYVTVAYNLHGAFANSGTITLVV